MTTTQPRVGFMRHAIFVALPVIAALVVACSSGDDDSADTADAESTTTTAPEDFEMQASDFANLHDMTAVRGFFVDNKLDHLDEALAVANDTEGGGAYPVGTVIQLIPQEAMVKRAPGFSPETNDWEFFALGVSAEGTEITTRGGADVINQFGGSCADCHELAKPEFDFVCEKDHGCEPLPIGDDVIHSVQESDPRPL
ncbi:MAG TPA: hypothetical protein VGO78_26150 [Acidimicrobiales bacterium]|jgi:hypothetical protein|nr:hypothetical protein [Acidimicrobiales bacterium]